MGFSLLIRANICIFAFTLCTSPRNSPPLRQMHIFRCLDAAGLLLDDGNRPARNPPPRTGSATALTAAAARIITVCVYDILHREGHSTRVDTCAGLSNLCRASPRRAAAGRTLLIGHPLTDVSLHH